MARAIAAHAGCDPRTVAKVISGSPVRPLAKARVLRALADLRLEHMAPRPEQPAEVLALATPGVPR